MRLNLKLLGSMGIGAWIMYLLDADRGRRRRALLRDKAVHLGHASGDALDTATRDLAHRSRGLLAATRSRFMTEYAPDDVLVERVRSRMGRFVSHPSSIEVTALDGYVTLRGPILAHEVDDLLNAVSSVRGVRGVENELEVHKEANGVPALQGGAGRPGAKPEIFQENWAPATRFLTALTGGTMVSWALRRRSLPAAFGALLGTGLLARGLSNVPVRRMIGAGGRRAVDFRKTIHIPAPAEEVFEFWTNFENFPRFMSHLLEVRKSGEGLSYWVARGPAGTEIAWEAEVTELVPNELIAWRSVPGAAVKSAGVVRFDPENGGTRLDIRMTYNPPAGALGHVVAAIFGVDPKHAMDEDLVRLQSLFAEGKTTADGREVTLAELESGAGAAGPRLIAGEPEEELEADRQEETDRGVRTPRRSGYDYGRRPGSAPARSDRIGVGGAPETASAEEPERGPDSTPPGGSAPSKDDASPSIEQDTAIAPPREAGAPVDYGSPAAGAPLEYGPRDTDALVDYGSTAGGTPPEYESRVADETPSKDDTDGSGTTAEEAAAGADLDATGFESVPTEDEINRRGKSRRAQTGAGRRTERGAERGKIDDGPRK